MSDNGSIFNCKAHPTLYWFNTKPNGSICFMGETVEVDGQMMLKEGTVDTLPPMKVLKARLNGVNPYDSRLNLEYEMTWEDVVKFVAYIKKTSAYIARECECPASLLRRVDGMTWEQVNSLPVVPLPSRTGA